MNQAIEEIRSLLRQADEVLALRDEPTRTPKQRDDDLAAAQRAHRRAIALLETLQADAQIDEAFVAELAPLQVEVADLEILIAEIRFDDGESTLRIPRLRGADA